MPTLADFLALAREVPATFWGVVIGAFFSLGGITLTNRAQDRRQRGQLEHDQEVRRRDREFALRRDVYLAASEAFSAGLIAIGRFGDPNIPIDKVLAAYLEKAPSVAKVMVTANERTVRAVVEFAGELNAAYVRLAGKRAPLDFQKLQLEALMEQIKIVSRARDQILEDMKQHNLDHASDQKRWAVLQANFEFQQNQGAEANAQAEQMRKALFPKQIAYAEESIGEVARLGRLLAVVTLSIRSELGMSIDEAEYKKIVDEAMTKQEAVVKQLTEAARTFLGSMPSPG